MLYLGDDRLLLIDLGPVDGTGDRWETLGCPLLDPTNFSAIRRWPGRTVPSASRLPAFTGGAELKHRVVADAGDEGDQVGGRGHR